MWRPATGQDITAMTAMAVDHFQCEIDDFFTADPVAYSRNLTRAVVEQFYAPNTELVMVYYQDTELLAYTWANIETTAWSDEPMAVVKIAHVAMSLSVRQRLRLLDQMMSLWRVWCVESGIPVICSTTVRDSQKGFLRLHERAGYTVRGSFAYLRLV